MAHVYDKYVKMSQILKKMTCLPDIATMYKLLKNFVVQEGNFSVAATFYVQHIRIRQECSFMLAGLVVMLVDVMDDFNS